MTRRERGVGALFVTVATAMLAGCATSGPGANCPEMDVYIRLVLPQNIEVQRFLTKPVRFGAGDGERPNGLELVLAAHDASGDLTKLVGRLHFELNEYRVASGDRVGRRIALWAVELLTLEDMQRYWDPLARFYRFPLELQNMTLEPGRYVLSAQLDCSQRDRLFDEYEFVCEPGPAPAAKKR